MDDFIEFARRRLASRSKRNPATGCLEWLGTLSEKGYGRFRYRNKWVRAHRAAYIVAKGPIPCGLWVLHSCDNPGCVEVDHLRLGVVQDNVDDMLGRGRHRGWVAQGSASRYRGTRNHAAQVTPEDVLKIRASNNLEPRLLAMAYGISERQIRRIQDNTHWAWLTADLPRNAFSA